MYKYLFRLAPATKRSTHWMGMGESRWNINWNTRVKVNRSFRNLEDDSWKSTRLRELPASAGYLRSVHRAVFTYAGYRYVMTVNGCCTYTFLLSSSSYRHTPTRSRWERKNTFVNRTMKQRRSTVVVIVYSFCKIRFPASIVCGIFLLKNDKMTRFNRLPYPEPWYTQRAFVCTRSENRVKDLWSS